MSISHQLKKIKPEELYYDIDTSGGQGGSGILIEKGGSPYVIGVHTYGERGLNRSSSGVRLTPAKFEQIKGWISKSFKPPIMAQIVLAIDHIDKITQNLDESAVMLLGNTGSGKSALLDYLNGTKLTPVLDDRNRYIFQDTDTISSSSKSKTTYPRVIKIKGVTYYDCPGFRDTRGSDQDIINAYSIYKFIEKTPKTKIVMVASEDSVSTQVERGSPFLKPFTQLGEVFKVNEKEIMNNLCLVITCREGLAPTGIKNILSRFIQESPKGFGKKILKSLKRACTSMEENHSAEQENNFKTNIAFFSRPTKEGPLPGDKDKIIDGINKIDFLPLRPHFSISQETFFTLMG